MCFCVWYLCADSRPLSPSSRSSLIVEGMEGSNAFRSTTPRPSPCSTPTLMPPPSPWRWNCTRRIAAPLKPRRCGLVVRLWENKLLKMQKERRGSLICGGQREWSDGWWETDHRQIDNRNQTENLISSLPVSWRFKLFFSLFSAPFSLLMSRDTKAK